MPRDHSKGAASSMTSFAAKWRFKIMRKTRRMTASLSMLDAAE
jgi:hypothetical protein